MCHSLFSLWVVDYFFFSDIISVIQKKDLICALLLNKQFSAFCSFIISVDLIYKSPEQISCPDCSWFQMVSHEIFQYILELVIKWKVYSIFLCCFFSPLPLCTVIIRICCSFGRDFFQQFQFLFLLF